MDKLKRVTQDTCKVLRQEEVVLPSKYFEVFNSQAQELDLDLNDQQIQDKIQQDLDRIHQIVHETSLHLDQFEKSAATAKEAIENKDEEILDECISDVETLHKNLVALQDELYTDSLSKIFNRRWITEKFLDKEGNFQSQGTFVFLDLNKFKQINDTFGHLVGDNVIRFFATFLKGQFKKESLVRFAGDEFILFCEKQKNVESDLERVTHSLEAKKLVTASGEAIRISFSYGLEPYDIGMSFSDIFDKADKKMYEMKNAL